MWINGLEEYRDRYPYGYFFGLPPEVRDRAAEWLNCFLERRPECSRRLFAILVGQAKRLALNPPTSAWGRSMRAKKGGYAVQRLYQRQGRVGRLHPALCAARVSASRRKRKAGFVE